MRGVDIAYALPDLLVMILIGVLIGRGTYGILISLGLVSWMGTARLVRAQFLQLQHEEFVEAARAAGQNGLLIVWKHLLPNAHGTDHRGSDVHCSFGDSLRINAQFHRAGIVSTSLQLGHIGERTAGVHYADIRI